MISHIIKRNCQNLVVKKSFFLSKVVIFPLCFLNNEPLNVLGYIFFFIIIERLWFRMVI